MGKSHKKFPRYRDNLWGKSLKKGKQYNNRKIRRKIKDVSIDVGNGTDYRRFGLDSWDLWEYRSYRPLQTVIEDWEYDQIRKIQGINTWLHYEPTLEEEIQDWERRYLRK